MNKASAPAGETKATRAWDRGFAAGLAYGKAQRDDLWHRNRALLQAIEGAARYLVPHIADPDGGVPVVDLPPPEPVSAEAVRRGVARRGGEKPSAKPAGAPTDG